MTKRNLILRAAVVAAFTISSSAAFAAVVALSPTTASTPAKFATELLSANIALVNTAHALDLTFNPTWGVAAGNHLYVRVDLTNGKFKTVLTSASLTSVIGTAAAAGVATVAISSGGSAGSTYVVFDLSNTVGVQLGHLLTLLPTDLTLLDPAQAIGVKVNVYTDTGAASIGASGLGGTLSDTYVTKSNGLSTVFTPDTTTAIVAKQFKEFDKSTTSTNVSAGKVALLGTLATTLNSVLKPGLTFGAAVVADDFATTSDLELTGDFSGVGTPITGSVQASTADDCASGLVTATLNTAKTTATFTGYDTLTATIAAGPTYLCYTVDGSTVLQAQTIVGNLTFSGVGGVTVPVRTATAGIIVRDGTTMVAPLTQIPSGWISRLVLNNSGSIARDYTVRSLTVDGVQAALTGAAAAGTIAANTSVIVDLTTTMTTTANRSSLVVNVAGPKSDVDGLYQIVNPTSGSVSNHVLSYK